MFCSQSADAMQEPERCAGDVGANEHLLLKWHCRYTRHKMQTSLNPIFWNHTWWLYQRWSLRKQKRPAGPVWQCGLVRVWSGPLQLLLGLTSQSEDNQPAVFADSLPATTLPQLGCLQGLNLQGPTGQKGPQGPPGLLCPCRPWAL